MPNKRDLNLSKCKISKYRYRELRNFCLQYGDKKQELATLRGLSAVSCDGMPHGSAANNPTQSKAEKATRLSKDIELIEQTAIEADGSIYRSLLANISNTDMPYEVLPVPCGRRQFYEIRHKFFYLLDKNKK